MVTVGQILQKERIKQGLTLDYIEKQIKIRVKTLKALEENNWSAFSSKIYITGIIGNYARLLGLDTKKIIAFFRRDYEKKEEVKFKEKVSSSYLIPGSRRFFLGLLIFSFFLVAVYFSYQLKLYFSPPKLTFISPNTDYFKTEKKIVVVGKTEKDASVIIAGERIYTDDEGVFRYELPLMEGKNKLVIKLTGANGRKTEVEKMFTKTSPK